MTSQKFNTFPWVAEPIRIMASEPDNERFADLKKLIQHRFKIDVVDRAMDSGEGGLAILILDDFTLKIIADAIPMSVLTEWGVTAVVNVKFKREPISLIPIYFISEGSIDKVIEDWEQAEYQQYATPINLFFCQTLSKENIDLIVSKKIAKHLKTFACVPLNFDAVESKTFYIGDRKDCLKTLFLGSDEAAKKSYLTKIATELSDLFIMFRIQPQIRYSADSPICNTMKDLFKKSYDNMSTTMTGYEEKEERPILLIVDRTIDPIAPAMYELHYQSMLYDLLPIGEDGSVTVGHGEKEHPFIVSDEDPVWLDARLRHIGEVSQLLPKQLSDLKKGNAAMKFQESKKKGQKMNSDQYMAALRDQASFKEKTAGLSTHVDIVGKLLGKVMENDGGIKNIITLQESLTTGVDEDGYKIKANAMKTEVEEQLKNEKMTQVPKCRLLLSYVAGIAAQHAQNKGALFGMAGLDDEHQTAYNNLAKLGVDLREGQFKSLRMKEKEVKAYAKTQLDGFARRHIPLLFFFVDDLLQNRLSETEFPWFMKSKKGGAQEEEKKKPPRSFRYGAKKVVATTDGTDLPKLFVFVLGGMTYSESRALQGAAEHANYNVFCGSSHRWIAEDYIDALAEN